MFQHETWHTASLDKHFSSGEFFVSARNVYETVIVRGDGDGISVTVSCPVWHFYNECFGNPVPLIHIIFPVPEIFFFLLCMFAVWNFKINK